MSRESSNFDIIKANCFIGSQFLTQGKQFFVRPGTGLDCNSGLSPKRALKTLAAALAKMTANQNDVVWFMSESNSKDDTTDFLTETLDWNKDLCHIFGVNAGQPVGQRSRVEHISTYVTASNLFTLSANGCIIANVHFFTGVADVNPTGCMQVTGERNRIYNCHIAGIGHANNDIAGAYSLKLTGDENQFEKCTIGLDTIARGTAANSGLLLDTTATRNQFLDCFFVAWVEHATNHVHVRFADATAIDRWLWFKNCLFAYMSENYAIGATGVMKLTAALTKGYIVVEDCMAFSDKPAVAVKWDVDDRNKIVIVGSPTPAADTCNVGRWV